MKISVQRHPNSAHLIRITCGDYILWFSYDTCIALETPDDRIMTNVFFSRTTTRHKKLIEARAVPDEVFQRKLRECEFS